MLLLMVPLIMKSGSGKRRVRWLSLPTPLTITPSPPHPPQVVSEYDSLSRLDAWKTTMLVRVKRKLQGGAAAAAGAAGAPQPVVVEGDDLT